jgi:hypothetical protein
MSTTVDVTSDALAPSTRPRLRLVPAPDCDPPVDLELTQRGAAAVLLGRRRAKARQGELPLQYQLRSGIPAVPSPPALRLVAPRHTIAGPGTGADPEPPEPWTGDDDDEPAVELTGRAELPDPRAWSARLAQAVLEVAAGARPSSQLWRWTTQAVLDDVRQRSRPATVLDSQRRRAQVPALVRSVHVCEPADGVVEATAIVAGRLRTRALALRLEGLNGRWLCTALEWV